MDFRGSDPSGSGTISTGSSDAISTGPTGTGPTGTGPTGTSPTSTGTGLTGTSPTSTGTGLTGTITGPRREDLLPTTATSAVKIVIVGGFGVGKTTMVGSVSEIRPLTTEETMTRAGVGVDDNSGVESKTATTVAMDFGRISITDRLVLYLFGTPGQERFWFLWNGLFEGALGAVVLVDTRRLEVSFDVIGRLEERGVPFVVAVNTFPDAPHHPAEELRKALDLPDEVPMVDCDARLRASCRDVLLTLTRYLYALSVPPG